MMAGTDPQRKLLTLIRDFACEKSQGEKRVVGLKKRIEELSSELETANEEHEEAKRSKETAEQELKGYEVQSSLNGSSILTLEARVSLIQNEISFVASEVDCLKSQEGSSRDEFISQMFQLNSRIRKFQEEVSTKLQENSIAEATNGKIVKKVDSSNLQDMLSNVVSQAVKEEQEFVAEENVQKQLQQEYIDLQRKVSLIEMIMNETRALQSLARLLNLNSVMDPLVRNCRTDVFAPVVVATMWKHWVKFFWKKRQIDFLENLITPECGTSVDADGNNNAVKSDKCLFCERL